MPVPEKNIAEWLSALVTTMADDPAIELLNFKVRGQSLGSEGGEMPSKMILGDLIGEGAGAYDPEIPGQPSYFLAFAVLVRWDTESGYDTARAATVQGVERVREILTNPGPGVGAADRVSVDYDQASVFNGVRYFAAYIEAEARVL